MNKAIEPRCNEIKLPIKTQCTFCGNYPRFKTLDDDTGYLYCLDCLIKKRPDVAKLIVERYNKTKLI